MPELPEVETVKRSLALKIINKKITQCDIYYPKVIATPEVKEFLQKIKNQKFISLRRRGKYLIFELDDYFLISHLRMEGKYFIKGKQEPPSKHEHIVFTLDEEETLRYHDTRKFGRMYLINKESHLKELDCLGKEPFDETLTTSYLKEKFQNKSMPIKTILLSQDIIAGIGNIYADEILFLSKINPLVKGGDLTFQELQQIIDNTRSILNHAILEGGTTIHSYQSLNGITGKFQNYLNVHGQVKCPTCKETIIKIKVNGRGTYYCPKCQK